MLPNRFVEVFLQILSYANILLKNILILQSKQNSLFNLTVPPKIWGIATHFGEQVFLSKENKCECIVLA